AALDGGTGAGPDGPRNPVRTRREGRLVRSLPNRQTDGMDPDIIYRHRLPVRIMHWVNVVCLVILLGSGLQIFNAHPALYWGADSRDATLLLQLDRFPSWATSPGPHWL